MCNAEIIISSNVGVICVSSFSNSVIQTCDNIIEISAVQYSIN
jgi:hypothetical protein